MLANEVCHGVDGFFCGCGDSGFSRLKGMGGIAAKGSLDHRCGDQKRKRKTFFIKNLTIRNNDFSLNNTTKKIFFH